MYLSDVIKLLYHSLGLSPGHWADFLKINKDVLSCSDAIQIDDFLIPNDGSIRIPKIRLVILSSFIMGLLLYFLW